MAVKDCVMMMIMIIMPMRLELRANNIRTEKKSLSQLIAAYTPGNDASKRVLEKVGFKKGEFLRERIELWFNRGKGRKSDIQCMYIDRPRSSE